MPTPEQTEAEPVNEDRDSSRAAARPLDPAAEGSAELKLLRELTGFRVHHATRVTELQAEIDRLRALNGEMKQALADVLALPVIAASFPHLDKGIGTKLPQGMTLLRARALANQE